MVLIDALNPTKVRRTGKDLQLLDETRFWREATG
jgi:hypothetical protein